MSLSTEWAAALLSLTYHSLSLDLTPHFGTVTKIWCTSNHLQSWIQVGDPELKSLHLFTWLRPCGQTKMDLMDSETFHI